MSRYNQHGTGVKLTRPKLWVRGVKEVLRARGKPASSWRVITDFVQWVKTNQVENPEKPGELLSPPDEDYLIWMMNKGIIFNCRFTNRKTNYWSVALVSSSVDHGDAADDVPVDINMAVAKPEKLSAKAKKKLEIAEKMYGTKHPKTPSSELMDSPPTGMESGMQQPISPDYIRRLITPQVDTVVKDMLKHYLAPLLDQVQVLTDRVDSLEILLEREREKRDNAAGRPPKTVRKPKKVTIGRKR